MKVNWFAINRSIVENELFIKKPLWGWAWVRILAETDYRSAQVCLTEVYRDLVNHFTYPQWRHMINVFVKEGMLEINETVNLGDRAGHRQLATVSNWSKYQKTAQSEQQRAHRTSRSASTERSDVQDEENDTSTQSEHSASSSASTERVAVSIKNKFQEVEEVKERTIDAREDPKVPESEKAYGEVDYIVGYHNAEWLRDKRSFNFTRAHSVWGSRLEILWRRSLDHPSRKAGDRAIFRFQDACEGNLDFDGVASTVASETPLADRLPPGTPVSHPVWGDDVIRYYRQDGQIVLNDCGALVPPREVTPCLN